MIIFQTVRVLATDLTMGTNLTAQSIQDSASDWESINFLTYLIFQCSSKVQSLQQYWDNVPLIIMVCIIKPSRYHTYPGIIIATISASPSVETDHIQKYGGLHSPEERELSVDPRLSPLPSRNRLVSCSPSPTGTERAR